MRRREVHQRGFTLVELLVVFAIMIILAALLMPAVQRSRRQAVITTCMAGQRQLVVAMKVYAHDHDDQLPRFDNYSGAANLSDVPWAFYNTMHNQYGVPQRCFFCPAADTALVDTYWNYWGTSEICLGYSIWVPHICTSQMVPPIRGQGLDVIEPDTVMRGPIRLANPANNPIVSDPIYMYSNAVTGDPTQFNFGNAPETLFWYNYGGHFWAGKFECATVGWADGHVEIHNATDTHIYYLSYNSWNCR